MARGKTKQKANPPPKKQPEEPTYPWGSYTTVPIPRDDAERLVAALRQARYKVELKTEGVLVSIHYAPPVWKSSRRVVRFETIVKRLWPENSGGGALLEEQARLPL